MTVWSGIRANKYYKLCLFNLKSKYVCLCHLITATIGNHDYQQQQQCVSAKTKEKP